MNARQDFLEKLAFSQLMRDRYLTILYRYLAGGDHYVFLEKSRCSLLLQKRLAIDTVLQTRTGGSVCIEEKIEQRARPNFALETESCTVAGHESPGWMRYAQADYLLYAFCVTVAGTVPGLEVYLMDFAALCQWFWEHEQDYPTYTMPRFNHTRLRLVPIVEVGNAIGWAHYLVTTQVQVLPAGLPLIRQSA